MTWAELIDCAADGDFDDWFQSEISMLVQPAVVGLREEVDRLLAAAKDEAGRMEGVARDRYRIFDTHALKATASVRRKLLADRQATPPPAEISGDGLRAMVLALSDLARFRVVCELQRDLERVRAPLIALAGEDPPVKDFVRDTELRRPLAGHRAVQFVVPRGGVLVEIQLMTELQHAWDRRNHCVYEWLREGGGDEGLDLRIDEHAVAEALYVADRMAEFNFERFLELRRRS